MKKVKFGNMKILAHSFESILTSEDIKYTPRPWNRFEPEESLWWLLPTNEWPAYKYGKYQLWKDDKYLNIGVTIEKGFGELAAIAFPKLKKKDTIIEDKWMWNKLYIDMDNGKLEETLNKFEKNINQDVFINMNIGLAFDPSDYDPMKPKSDNITYKYNQGKLSLLNHRNSRGVLEELKNAKSINNIKETISNYKDINWTWIDYIIYTRFLRADMKDLDNNDLISTTEICDKFKPLKKYIGILY